MITIRDALGIGAIALVALGLGCSSGGGNGAPAGRGTPACNQWQSAVCEWITKCQVSGAATTCEQLKGIACKSDAEAQRCATAVASASCTSPPANCNIADLADPVPAKKACEDFQAAACQRNEECQPGTRDACLEQIKGTLDCSVVIGVALAYEQCMTEIKTVACTSTTGPDSCKGVLLR